MQLNKSKYLDILQIFRGFAALMVVIHHSVGSIKFYHKIDNNVLNYVGSIGKFGVDFFFVLSGFIITYTSFYKYTEPNSFSNYLKNRLIRIYIPYLPIGIFMLILYSTLPSLSNSNREISLLSSITLIPEGNPALSVAWTLSFELCFYILFSITFISNKIWNFFVGLWMCLILICNYTFLSEIQLIKFPVISTFISTYNIEFILGFILAKLIIREVKVNIFYCSTFFVIMLFLIFYYKGLNIEFFKFSINIIFALVSFILIYTSIIYFNKKIKNTNIFMLIGNATYSIYLVHNPLQMILYRIYPKINSITSLLFSLLLALLLLSSIGGYIYYLIFEKKLIHWVKLKLIKEIV